MGRKNGPREAMAVGEPNMDLSCSMNNARRAVDIGTTEAFPFPAHRFDRECELCEPRLEVVGQSRTG